jgi:hypothetical protein
MKSALLALALLGAAALPAAAVEPIKFSQTFTIPDTLSCPDGTVITGVAAFTENGIAFRDASGSTTHVILHDSIDVSFIGPNGKIASGTNRQNETFNVNTGAFAVRGVLTNLSVDGVQVAHAAGQLSIDANGNVKVVTPQIANSDVPNICAALE